MGFSARSGTAAAAMPGHELRIEVRAGELGRVPLLDHEEMATLGGGHEQVDIAASALAAGQNDVSSEHCREVGFSIRNEL